MTVICPDCDARWIGRKIEHCRHDGCHQTFTSTRAGDRHLVDRDPDTGRARHLTPDEMRVLRRRNGTPWYATWTNPHGTQLWAEHNPKPHPLARARDSDGLTGAP
ncbi:MAG: hypothetical protein ACRD0W_25900 [Acidimicrobiales bacterium]